MVSTNWSNTTNQTTNWVPDGEDIVQGTPIGITLIFLREIVTSLSSADDDANWSNNTSPSTNWTKT